uniref:Uncharacterized protein n=1 Tax=Arundo donax TaxID=35708 RepID=A0A0A9CWF5_ARUDO
MSVAAATDHLSLSGGCTGVPPPPAHPPCAGVLVLFPRRCRRAWLPDSVRPLNDARRYQAPVCVPERHLRNVRFSHSLVRYPNIVK